MKNPTILASLTVLVAATFLDVTVTASSSRCQIVKKREMKKYGCQDTSCVVEVKTKDQSSFERYDLDKDGRMSYVELEMLANDEVPGPKLLRAKLSGEKMKQIQNTLKLIFLGTDEVKIGGYLSQDGTLVAYDLNKDNKISQNEMKSYLQDKEHCCFKSGRKSIMC